MMRPAGTVADRDSSCFVEAVADDVPGEAGVWQQSPAVLLSELNAAGPSRPSRWPSGVARPRSLLGPTRRLRKRRSAGPGHATMAV